MIGRLTRFVSERPKVLGKTFTLRDGELAGETAGQLCRGRYVVESFDSADALVSLLLSFGPDQALSASLPLDGSTDGAIVTEREAPNHPAAKTRTKRFFSLPDEPGLLVGDYDPQGDPLSREDLFQAMLAAAPAVVEATVIHWFSASSLIHDGDRCLKRAAGQRLYIPVRSLADVPRALRAINARAWINGHGTFAISSSGSLLERPLFDPAMADAGARLDFAPTGAICTAPLEQRRGSPTILTLSPALCFDTRAILDLSDAEQQTSRSKREQELERKRPDAEARRAVFRREHERATIERAVVNGQTADLDQVRAQASRTLEAALSGTLLPDFPLVHVDQQGKEHQVIVGDLLADRERWHLAKFLCPLNEEHRSRSPDAILYADQPVPVIYDLDIHTAYRLVRQRAILSVVQGRRADLADAIAEHLREEPDILCSSGQLVQVAPHGFTSLTLPLLAHKIGRTCALDKVDGRSGKRVAVDVDDSTARQVHALLLQRAQRVIVRSTIPLVDAEGRIYDRPGLDRASGAYLDMEPGSLPVIPSSPTREQCISAATRLYKPWSEYCWDTPHSRAALLAMVLTVPLRPLIETAPGLFVSAYAVGAGKTKCAEAIASLVLGRRPGPTSWPKDDDEAKKLILALAREGEAAVLIDNLKGVWDSEPLATAIASGHFKGRVLGVSETAQAPMRTLWLASGNRATMSRDLARRHMVALVDPQTENPQALSYNFDPLESALADRLGVIVSALTLWRGWHHAGRPGHDGCDCGFAVWSRTVRALVRWLADSGIADDAGVGALGDPAHAILTLEAAFGDPNDMADSNLVLGLHEAWGLAPFETSDVSKLFKQGKVLAERNTHTATATADAPDVGAVMVYEALSSIKPEAMRAPQGISTQSTHAVLWNRRGRRIGKLRIDLVSRSSRSTTWRIASD